MPIPADLRDIVESALQKSHAGQLAWITADEFGERDEADDFFVAFPDYAINVWQSVPTGWDDDTEPQVAFSIRDAKGRTLTSFVIRQSDQDYATMKNLLLSAKRRALNVDQALDDVRRRLAAV